MHDRTDHAGALRLLASGAAWQCGETATMLEDAADEIERLGAEVARLRTALRKIVQECGRARGDQGHRDASRFAFATAYKAAGEGVADV